MKEVFINSDNIVSPLGSTSAENFSQLTRSITGIKKHKHLAMSDEPFCASLFNHTAESLYNNNGYTKFEQLLIDSITGALNKSTIDNSSNRTILIISTTKGNISLLETETDNEVTRDRIALHHSARKIAAHFQFVNQPVIISNACISGLLAMIMGMRLLRSGQYDHAIIAGADVISKFILSGFQSFQAISPEPCRPFDESRKGINLGEAAGTVILSSDPAHSRGTCLTGGSVSNDANHISGPSRTGEELCKAILKTLDDASMSAGDIDFICSHGTATLFNDEMEAKAITMAGLQSVPVNSLKGYFGHTLGAAGLIESIVSLHSLEENCIIPTAGFEKLGVSMPINVCDQLMEIPVKNCLKTASGFGGCNAAIIITKL